MRPRWSAPTGASPRCPSLRRPRREVMAPASDDSTGRGSQPFSVPEEHSGRNPHHDRPAQPGHPGGDLRPARPGPPAHPRRGPDRPDRLPRTQSTAAVPDRRRPRHERGARGGRRRLALPGRPVPPRRRHEHNGGGAVKMNTFSGDQIAQVNNPDPTAVLVGVAWRQYGWPGPLTLTAVIVAVLGVWWWRWRASFRRHVLVRVLGQWRRWHYQRHWTAVMTIGRLAPLYQGRLLLPVLGKITSTPY